MNDRGEEAFGECSTCKGDTVDVGNDRPQEAVSLGQAMILCGSSVRRRNGADEKASVVEGPSIRGLR